MDILIVGGGPGGLLLAGALRRCDPAHRVTVRERRPAGATHGWGIAVSTATSYRDDLLHRVERVDPTAAAALRSASVEWGGQHVSMPGARPVHLGGSGYCLGRQRLIDVLTDRARASGAEVCFDSEVVDPAAVADHDLVVLADGAGSRIRRSRSDRFGTTESAGRNRHVWLGTSLAFEDFTYAFERTAAGWIWFYGYRHAPDAGTVIVECSAETWAGLGFDAADDAETTTALSRIFARHLAGHPLHVRPGAGGRSPWESFTTIRNDRWSDGHLVLLGDSAHTAHFSIGSGTTMALADAAALGRALDGRRAADLPAALRAYEDERRPAVLALQDAAARSAGWFERIDRHADLPPLEFGFALRMRRNVDEAAPRSSALLHGLHRATQWRIGRSLRRTVARRRRAIRRRRAGVG